MFGLFIVVCWNDNFLESILKKEKSGHWQDRIEYEFKYRITIMTGIIVLGNNYLKAIAAEDFINDVNTHFIHGSYMPD